MPTQFWRTARNFIFGGMMQKPGIKTTEFWLSLIAQIVPVFVILGVLNAEEATTLVDSITRAAAAIGSLVAAAWPVVEYIKSRAKIKSV